MPISLVEAISRVPQWRGKSITTSYLTEGITNQNVRVNVDGVSFVLRLGGENTELLGICRNDEYAAHLAAALRGIAPEVIYFIEPEGCLVTRFIEGRTLSLAEMARPENIRRVAGTLRQIHSIDSIPGLFSSFRTVERYAEIAGRLELVLPDNFDWIRAATRQLEEVYRMIPCALRSCHNDLMNANFLDDGRIRILDWEYAGMGDVFFDLANFSSHHGFTEEQDRFLLECYLGRNTAADLARLNLMKIMSDLREAMWGIVQVGISKLAFDFCAYAGEYFDRTTTRLRHPAHARWLREAAAHV